MKISREELHKFVRANANGFDGREIKGADNLSELGLDSLGLATLLFAIEERLEIQIDESYLSGLNNMSTVADLVGVFKDMGYHIEL